MKKISFVLLSLSLIGCASGKKNNLRMHTELTVNEMHDDVNFVERKLFNMHPDVDLYITKEALHKKFDSLNNTITEPLKPNDFYLKIAPVIASVRQGHMSLNLLSEQLEKTNKKKYIGSKSPLSQFDFLWNDGNLYVLKNNSENKEIKEGAVIIDINGNTPQNFYEKYRSSITSDGFNETFIEKWFGRKILGYYASEIGIVDSLTLKINCSDSISSHTIHRIFKKENSQSKTIKDSTGIAKNDRSKSIKKILTKKQRRAEKDSLKLLAKRDRIYKYDRTKKEYTINLSYPTNDSTFAVLKVQSFTETKYKKAYKAIFEEIRKQNIRNLVLDLRGNTGGRVSEIDELYSYLTTDEKYTLLKPTVVTSKWKLPYYMHAGRSPLHYVLLSPFYIIQSPIVFFKTKKGNDGKFYYKLEQEKKNNRKKNSYSGELFVLTDGLSFSAASVISANLKGTKRATFIGNETGGTYNGTVAGRLPILTLPNSKLKWRLGVMNVSPTEQTEEFGHGIRPDILIIPTTEQVLNKEDPEMEWILNNLGIEK